MSQMSNMAETIAELRIAATAINAAASWLARQFESTPAKEPVVTLETVRAVLAEKSRNGHTAEIRALLEKYGATKLSEIDPGKYPALLAEAEVLENE